MRLVILPLSWSPAKPPVDSGLLVPEGISDVIERAAGLNDPNIQSPEACAAVTTTYTLTITDGQGCMFSDNLSITVDSVRLMENYVLFLTGAGNLDMGKTNSFFGSVGINRVGGKTTLANGNMIFGDLVSDTVIMGNNNSVSGTIYANFFQEGTGNTYAQVISFSFPINDLKDLTVVDSSGGPPPPPTSSCPGGEDILVGPDDNDFFLRMMAQLTKMRSGIPLMSIS